MADISHQIKTPLTSANIVVDLLSAESISDERRIALLNQLQMLLDRIVWQIDGILKLSKLDAGMINFKCEHFGADELVKKAVEPILIPLELRNVAVNIKASGNAGLSGDLNWCAEAVENIVKNCMEHCEDSGQIDIICDENPLYTQIIVRDNGCGIAKNDLQHIFERFYQGENCSENNYGIGLALAKMIIERQNGTIKVQNRTDVRGAEFTVRFYKGAV